MKRLTLNKDKISSDTKRKLQYYGIDTDPLPVSSEGFTQE